MSLAEVQQLYNILVEIDAILKGVEVKSTTLEQKSESIKTNLSMVTQLERVFMRYLVIAKRAGLPDDVEAQIQRLSELVVMARMAQIAFTGLTRGPVGIAMSIASFALIAFNAYDMMRGQ